LTKVLIKNKVVQGAKTQSYCSQCALTSTDDTS
jgi:hypothetical protein